MDEWLIRWIEAIRAAYPAPRPEAVAAYLDTFDADSAANQAERQRVWEQLDERTRATLIDLNRRENPQLFS